MTRNISIVIPCYNEIANLEKLATTIRDNFQDEDIEFILVENGSTDKSREWFNTSKLIDGQLLRVCYVDKNRGYGYGIREGLKIAQGRYLGWMHADFQISPLEIKKAIEFIKQHNEFENVVFKGRRQNRRKSEIFFSMGMSLIMTLILGYRMTDINAVPVVISRTIIDDLRDTLPYDLDFDLYIYYYAIKRGHEIKRFDVEYSDRLEGKSSWDTGLRSRINASAQLIKKALMIREENRKHDNKF